MAERSQNAPTGRTATMPAPVFRAAHSPPTRVHGRICNAMSIDVEDYFQVQAFAGHVRRQDWDGFERRFEANTGLILDLLAAADVKATFFTLGWAAQRSKQLIRRIVNEGHELASHGMAHFRADLQSPEEFRRDTAESKAILEDVGGVKVSGYRAATFSIGLRNLWAFDILADEGYAYSSSINPVRHDLYGLPGAPRQPFYPCTDDRIIEFPITGVRYLGRNFPFGGGGFFRLLPYSLFRMGLRAVNETDNLASIFYLHPWEVDPGQPRIQEAVFKSRFRHYLNLSRTQQRFRKLLADFEWDRVDKVFAGALQAAAAKKASGATND